ncbi:hypothetical protein BV22DRAFT_1033778 [Leucogyrophana mollusca]|uniref:Uncharacterized protein n=1 Tax=Leucogyrophana mollusca TaxID=85980 RepID=A0ACB8BK53_9AGAM|nr:hypothetical protein BV22DRAFT_1033778 [Leucogyrophana mollusca]
MRYQHTALTTTHTINHLQYLSPRTIMDRTFAAGSQIIHGAADMPTLNTGDGDNNRGAIKTFTVRIPRNPANVNMEAILRACERALMDPHLQRASQANRGYSSTTMRHGSQVVMPGGYADCPTMNTGHGRNNVGAQKVYNIV